MGLACSAHWNRTNTHNVLVSKPEVATKSKLEVKINTMKTYGGVDVLLHVYLTAVQDGCN
jgi:hypothetical protein